MTSDSHGIQKIKGVAGGQATIANTRIAVWQLENYRRLGWDDQRILKNYPALQAFDLKNAWTYVENNRAEIDNAIAVNQES